MIGRRAVTTDEVLVDVEGQLVDFFGEHYPRLVRLAALVCHSAESVEDAVQAAMERAWRRRETLLDARRMKPWLDQIVVREAIRLNRRPWWSRVRSTHDDVSAELSDTSGGIDPTWVALSVAFQRLPPEQRAAMTLHLYAGYSVEETAALMGSRVETTRSRLRLARNVLRRELGEGER
jgi:RNA polymerase sigma-70 factor, ECF subfamily